MRRALVLGLLLCGCTYGQVTWGGDPVANVEISVSNCQQQSWYTTTNQNGWYGFDGYENSADYIPEGIVLILATLPDDTQRFEFRGIDYSACPDDPNKQCDREDIDLGFKPQTPWEWAVWHDANDAHNLEQANCFFHWCGLPFPCSL